MFNPSGPMPVFFFGSPEFSAEFEKLAAKIDFQPLKNATDVGFHRGGVVVVIELDHVARASMEELKRLQENLSWGAVQAMGFVVPFHDQSSPKDLRERIQKRIAQAGDEEAETLRRLLSELWRYGIAQWPQTEFEIHLTGALRRAAREIRRYQRFAFLNSIMMPLDGFPRAFFIFGALGAWLPTLLSWWFLPSWLPALARIQALAIAYPLRNLIRANRKGWRLSDRRSLVSGYSWTLGIHLVALTVVMGKSITSLLPWLALGLALHAAWEAWGHLRERFSHAEAMIPWLAEEDGVRQWRSANPHAESIRMSKLADEKENDRMLRQMRFKTRWGMFRDASPATWSRVFISHRRREHGDGIALAVHDALKTRGLMQPWVDLRDLLDGQWAFDLSMAMAQCGVFVLVVTRETEDEQGDNPQETWGQGMGFVTGELELAFNLAVQYGQPEIIIIEAGASVEDLDLPEELRHNLRQFERFELKPPKKDGEYGDRIRESVIADEIESVLYRDPPTQIISPQVNGVLTLVFTSLWLSRIVSVPILAGMMFGWRPELAVWQQGLLLLSLFSGSVTTHLGDLIERATMPANPILYQVGKPITGFGLRHYLLLWLAAGVFLWQVWDIGANPWLQTALWCALWLNLNGSLFTPTIWQSERQKQAPPKTTDPVVPTPSSSSTSS